MTESQRHRETLIRLRTGWEKAASFSEMDGGWSGGDAYAQPANIEALTAALRAIEEREELREALEWLVHVNHGIGKSGHTPEPGEFEAAMKAGEQALALKEGASDVLR